MTFLGTVGATIAGVLLAAFLLIGLGFCALVLAFHMTRNTEPKREH